MICPNEVLLLLLNVQFVLLLSGIKEDRKPLHAQTVAVFPRHTTVWAYAAPSVDHPRLLLSWKGALSLSTCRTELSGGTEIAFDEGNSSALKRTGREVLHAVLNSEGTSAPWVRSPLVFLSL